MPVIPKGSVEGTTGTSYPGKLAEGMGRGITQSLGDAGDLTQFGAYLETLPSGATSSHRHWHEDEDEFLYMLTGEVTLIEDDGPHILHPGDAATWKAGVPNAHHLKNHTDAPATYLIIGTRAPRDVCHYAEVDLLYTFENGESRQTRANGEPLE